MHPNPSPEVKPDPKRFRSSINTRGRISLTSFRDFLGAPRGHGGRVGHRQMRRGAARASVAGPWHGGVAAVGQGPTGSVTAGSWVICRGSSLLCWQIPAQGHERLQPQWRSRQAHSVNLSRRPTVAGCDPFRTRRRAQTETGIDPTAGAQHLSLG